MKKIAVGLGVLLVLLSCDSSDSEQANKYLFEKLKAEETNIAFSNTITEDPEHNILNYIYYYNGAGVAAGDVNNDGLVDLYFVSNMGENKLYLNEGDLKFKDITKKAKVSGTASWNTGATMVDINNDGLLDIYVSAVSGLLDFQGHNELFINNGDGSFTEKSKDYGLDFEGYTTQAYFFDYDKDLDLDVYLVNHAVHTTLSHGKADVRNKRVPLVGDVLLKNENGKFIDASEEANIYGGVNGYGLSAAIADYNNDGWDDIYVANDFHEDDYYYINNQDGTFTEQLDKAFSTISRFSMGTDAADINADGYQDIISLDMLPNDEKVIKESEGDDAMYNMQKRLNHLGYKDQYARNMLQINNKGEYFEEMALLNNVAATDWSWGPLLADYNNDGHMDLFISNGILRRPNDLDFKKFVSAAFRDRNPGEGVKWLYNSREKMPEGKFSNQIFEGNSSKFENRTGHWIEDIASLSNGAVYADLDRDGDLDLVLNNLNDKAVIYKNTIDSAGAFLNLKFDYQGANKQGLGTKAIVYANGKKHMRQLFTSRGFLSSTDASLHIGVEDTKIDSVQIIWPNNRVQVLKDIKANQFLEVAFKNAETTEYSYQQAGSEGNKFRKTNLLEYVHREDRYDDFLNEKLIPYKVSSIGPAVAVGDIDNNGFEDIFLGNSSGSEARLYLNDGRKLELSNFSTIINDSVYEDNDAIFFDADNDSDLDLFVATGINKYGKRILMDDRLYINNNGSFNKSSGRMPENLFSSSTVTAADYDQDGDLDLFVGNLSDPGDFGKPVPSYLLVNDGTGKFSREKNFNLVSHVNSARWEDLNGDSYPELLVAAEWDNPIIFWNEKGNLRATSLPPNLSGLWQSIIAYDIDQDGDKDILLGNWGLNTRFDASVEAPLKMYHSDFNLDGVFESIIAYNKNGKYYPLQTRDELVAQMNFISKKFPSHQAFSMKTVEEIFSPSVISKSKQYSISNLASGYLLNEDGNFSKFIAFPQKFQTAPITNFELVNLNGEEQLLVSGNSLRVNTYHGGYTSFKGMFLKDVDNFTPVRAYGIAPFHQQIKKTVQIKMKDSNLLLVVTNNDTLDTYISKNE